MAGTAGMLEPSYLTLAANGELADRVNRLQAMLAECVLCPHQCRVDRYRELGVCRTGAEPVIAAATPHFGEEPVISGSRGSGTVFLAGCNLSCVYCQNHDISQPQPGRLTSPTSIESLAAVFLDLQKQGCHNLSWVSPTHQTAQLVSALAMAVEQGLRLPVVYNSNGYESIEVLQLLDGLVDIYLPDLKYADPVTAVELSNAPDYPHHARAAVTEMLRQVGDRWTVGADGTLLRGLLVRLLVLPNDLADIAESLQWISSELSPMVAVSLMAQYYPTHLATGCERFPLLSRTISDGEWARAITTLEEWMEGAHHYLQEHRTAPDYYRPDFSNPEVPFKDIQDF
jgi:putative pyruvate formate lyase activating enzyme